ncbi:acyltransferase [Stenotrophomonas maltophilia]|uniref:acyltransferase family protein n=1 Tax=Stenotrophomonas maltophilia TaxID=40324 RepID=UPI002ACD00D5|nr:acyltransferase [Stenotrophomonas maltophilia]MDZ5815110.1 acyltransferase [Stenotrophomonas maltophilia]
MKYNPALDGIRAVAVLVVVMFHAKAPGFGGGFFGVDVFFVLSGYLITRLLTQEHQQTGSIRLGHFYARRLRRLYPALLLFLFVYLVLAGTVLRTPLYTYWLHVRDAVLSAIYMQDYARTLGVYPYWLRHMWSLSIEEHFYLVWPVLLLGILKLDRRQAVTAMLVLYLGLTAWRAWSAFHLPTAWLVYNRFDTHSSGLILGCLLGYWRPRASPYAAVAGFLGLFACIAVFPHGAVHTAAFGFTAAELSAAMLVAAPPVWLTGSILPWIGRMSYGLYLWHYLLARVVRDRYWDWPETLALSLLGGLACAVISYHLVERRFHRRSLHVDSQGDVVGVAVARST